MSMQTWVETFNNTQVDSTALTNTVTPTTIIPTQGLITLPAAFFQIGRMLKITASGRISNLVTTPGTLSLDIRFGAVIVAAGGAMALNIVAKVNVPWYLEWILTCRAIGSGTSANMIHQGRWTSESVIASALPAAGGAGSHLLPNAAPAVGTGFDSTAAQAVNLFGTWSVANAANSILTHQYMVQSLN